jgi:hypothetical protein
VGNLAVDGTSMPPEEMTRNPIIYKVFGVFLGFIEILLEVLYGKLTFYH